MNYAHVSSTPSIEDQVTYVICRLNGHEMDLVTPPFVCVTCQSAAMDPAHSKGTNSINTDLYFRRAAALRYESYQYRSSTSINRYC